MLRARLKQLHPHLVCLASASNGGRSSEGSLLEAGTRCAGEVAAFINGRLREDGLELGRLSFVAYSLGGLVARVALRHPAMQPFLPALHAFVCVAAPHLGLAYAPSSVVSAGMYLYRAWRQSAALAELAFTDGNSSGGGSDAGADLRRGLVYSLACGWADAPAGAAAGPVVTALRAAGLDDAPNGVLLARCQHIVLIASEQDLYAPEPSVAVQWADAPLRDATHGPAHGEMVRSFWLGVAPERVTRWGVRFHALDSLVAGRVSLDGLVGKQAHLAMLETDALAHALALRLGHIWSE